MPSATGSRSVGGPTLVLLAVLFVGCGKQPAAPTTAAVESPRPTSTEPAQIELSDPKVTLEKPNLVRVEVRYKFTKGKPEKYYMVDVSFPGTMNHGTKPMMGSEMSSEGVIKDSFELFMPPVQTFEIHVSEADSPMTGYKLISNTVSGSVK